MRQAPPSQPMLQIPATYGQTPIGNGHHMGLSNYPPGVTGNEYAISGAEREWDEERECPLCGTLDIMPHEFHWEVGVRAWCTNPDCDYRTGFEVDTEEPEPYVPDYMDPE